MRGLMIGLMAVLALAGMALADSYTYTVAATNGGTYQSDPLPVSGWLDKIEFSQDASATCTVTVCSYAGTNATAVETYMTLSGTAADTDVVKTRFIGETSAGVAYAGVISGTETSAASTVLVAPYERPMLGGDIRVNVSSVNASDGTDNITVRILYEPLAR